MKRRPRFRLCFYCLIPSCLILSAFLLLFTNLSVNLFPDKGFQEFIKFTEIRRQNLSNYDVIRPSAIPASLTWDQFDKATFIFGKEGNSSDYAVKYANFETHEFDVKISDKIGARRDLPDTRPNECINFTYSEFSTPVSVIITFYNEARSALLRTIGSIFERTPANLLEEIILIDDHSDDDKIGLKLSYIRKVRVLRNKKREGLIRSRIFGTDISKAPVLVFIDSHCECNVNWIEPLLNRLNENKKAAVSPAIDVINAEDFTYTPVIDNLRGGFDWDLVFKWQNLNDSEIKARKGRAFLPIRTPIIAGGIFAIWREWFDSLGKYDEGMDVWGGENTEFSLRTSLCGGTLEVLPCSRVGHVFRAFHPYSFPGGTEKVVKKNFRRTAEVWLDEYIRYYIAEDRSHLKVDYGDITDRLNLKKRLKCRPFKWFLENVYPELRIPRKNETLVKLKIGNYCLTSGPYEANDSLNLALCDDIAHKFVWALNKRGQFLSYQEYCLSVERDEQKHQRYPTVMIEKCNSYDDDVQIWIFRNNQIFNQKTGLCLEMDQNGRKSKVILNDCQKTRRSQKWTLAVVIH